jgi:serine protease Do
VLPLHAARAQDDLAVKEEQAIQAAVERVAPSVVRIETLGGLETAGRFLFGTGPTTGIIVSEDGYVISSAFNFAQKPAQILVHIGEGSPLPAEIVSTDFNRHLVLLKVNADHPLPLPEAAPRKDIHIGQWSIAVGRTFADGKKPNLSVGIISATNRIWGRAIQTDAKISPANYGGPLIDIEGRVLGILAPLAQDGGGSGAASEIAGVEWYDSGIGFAVPLEDINELLPRMKAEKELRPGKLGVSLKRNNLYSGDVVIASAASGSPAQQAGLKAGDKIIEVDGAKITRQAELRQVLMPHYASDKLKIVAMRGTERIEREIELVAEIAPYEFPFLGVLPSREPSDKAGVGVRYVYPGSPAAEATIKPDDRILELNGQAVGDLDALVELMAAESLGREIELKLRRGDETLTRKLKLAALPEQIPAELPPAHGDLAQPDGDKPATGVVTIKIPEIANDCFAYIPETYNPAAPHGVVLWLHEPGGYKQDELVAQWKEHCAKHDLILLAPKSADSLKWQRNELEFIRKSLNDLLARYNIDRRRIAVVGVDGGGAMAYLFGFANRDLAPGVGVIGASLPTGTPIPSTDAVERQSFFIASAKQSPSAAQVQANIEQLRAQKHPVVTKDLGASPRALSAEEIAELARWIDSLDRI